MLPNFCRAVPVSPSGLDRCLAKVRGCDHTPDYLLLPKGYYYDVDFLGAARGHIIHEDVPVVEFQLYVH